MNHMPKDAADGLRAAVKDGMKRYEEMGFDITKLCGCGDCQAHTDRARKLYEQLMREGACTKSIAQIGHSLLDLNDILILSMNGISADEVMERSETFRLVMTYWNMRNTEKIIEFSALADELSRQNHKI